MSQCTGSCAVREKAKEIIIKGKRKFLKDFILNSSCFNNINVYFLISNYHKGYFCKELEPKLKNPKQIL